MNDELRTSIVLVSQKIDENNRRKEHTTNTDIERILSEIDANESLDVRKYSVELDYLLKEQEEDDFVGGFYASNLPADCL